MKRLCVSVCLLFIIGATSYVHAFPAWMGVYGDFQTHNGVNPGKHQILMNQDYVGLHAEACIQVNSNGYTCYPMSYLGADNGNSLWQYDTPVAYTSNDYVQFYFHGWDDWGGNI